MKTPIELTQILTQYEDAESAIAVYKEANLAIAQYQAVKDAALSLAENALRESGETNLKSIAGSCGWTTPKTAKLDQDAWNTAVLLDPSLSEILHHYQVAEEQLRDAEKPYMKLPPKRFFIR